jgi:hypothetical protein
LVAGVTLDEIHSIMVWSFKALATGKYPAEDHNNKAFSKDWDKHRFLKAGKAIAGDYKGAWSEQRGDWVYLVAALGLTSCWSTNYVCHLCRAHKKISRLLYTNFTRDALLRRTRYTNKQWLKWYEDTPWTASVLTQIPGFHIYRNWVDAMHSIDLGFLQWALPSALWELTDNQQVWPGTTRALRLYNAHKDYVDWCEAEGIEAVAPRFEEKKN